VLCICQSAGGDPNGRCSLLSYVFRDHRAAHAHVVLGLIYCLSGRYRARKFQAEDLEVSAFIDERKDKN